MTRDAITPEPEPAKPPTLATCGHLTGAPVVIGAVQSMSGGSGYTRNVCPDCAHKYPQHAVWDELPVMRRSTAN
ncbi:hypothetical protein GCM10010278_30480 [Streptomyces melanogenes]|nr:hypothetical protein GCM10010278_30480 [Streptomyces melanogenes]